MYFTIQKIQNKSSVSFNIFNITLKKKVISTVFFENIKI